MTGPAGSDVPAPVGAGAAPGGERKPRTVFGSLSAMVSAAVSGIYLLNPTAGVFELLPDNLPVVGNLDEAGATVLLLWALGYLLKGPGRGPLGPGGRPRG